MTFSFANIHIEIFMLLGMMLVFALVLQQQDRKMRAYEKRLKIMKSDFQALLLCSRGVGDRLNCQQREFKSLIDRQDRLELGDHGEPSYRQAAALLERGASCDEMADTCDLTEAEAELIAQLSQSRRNPRKMDLVA